MSVSCCYYWFKHCFRSVRDFSTSRWSTNAPEQFNPQRGEYRTMCSGQFVFSQVMDHLPWPIFNRCVQRYNGNRWVKSFRSSDQYRCTAFAQLTYREILRDIETCLQAQANKLYHVGITGGVSRNTSPTPIRSATGASTQT